MGSEGPRRNQEDSEGPRRTQKEPVRLSQLSQTGQAAFAASSFSSWLLPQREHCQTHLKMCAGSLKVSATILANLFLWRVVQCPFYTLINNKSWGNYNTAKLTLSVCWKCSH